MAEHHPLGDIEYLRENLLKNYKSGFPVLKELVQNAEDAGSTHFDFGWLEGIPNAEHPLLRTPALFIVDDGKFTNENARSIRYIIGGSNKPKEQDSIGKFGLGLKSIFHLCEAFFYIGPEIENAQSKRADIFNPWEDRDGDLYHPEWGRFTPSDCEKVKETLHQILELPEYQTQWFILWIPLRHCSHRTHELEEGGIQLGFIKNGQADIFDDKTPSFLSESKTKLELTLLLPLLHSLTTIRYWEKNLNFGQEKYLIYINSGERRHSSLSQLSPGKPHALEGKVNLASKAYCIDFNFSGQEIIHENDTFKKIFNMPGFPTKFKNIKPHTAVIFGRWRSQPANLMIRTAVFLPIASSQSNIQSQHSFCLMLHGYFFVDFARTGILGLNNQRYTIENQRSPGDDDDTVLKKAWNCTLYKSLMSHILDALKNFSQDLSNQEIEVLCKALSATPLFKENSQKICQEKQWVYVINPKHSCWQLIYKGQANLRLIPKIPFNWDAFSKLNEFAKHNYLTIKEKPNLFAEKSQFAWQVSELCKILDALEPAEVFLDIDNLRFLEAFLSDNQQETKVINEVKVQVSLIKLLQKAFAELDIAQLQSDENLPLVMKLLALVLPESRYAIAKVAADADEQSMYSILKKLYKKLYDKKLYELNFDFLLVYKTFELNPQSSKAELNPHQAVEILKCLSNICLEEPSQQKVGQDLIQQVLNSLDKPEIVLNSDLLETPIFTGYNYREQTHYIYTYSELQKLSNNLFNGSSEIPIVSALKEALPNCDLIFIDDQFAKILNQIPFFPTIQRCDIHSSMKLLATKPKLAGSKKRINLLKELIRHV